MPRSTIAGLPSPGTASRLASVTVSSLLNPPPKGRPDRSGSVAALGYSELSPPTTESPTCTASDGAGRRTAVPSSETPPLPGAQPQLVVASFWGAGSIRTDDCATRCPRSAPTGRAVAGLFLGGGERCERRVVGGRLVFGQCAHAGLHRVGDLGQIRLFSIASGSVTVWNPSPSTLIRKLRCSTSGNAGFVPPRCRPCCTALAFSAVGARR